MKTFRMVSQSSVHASLYCKMIIETLIKRSLCNSFNFKIKNGIILKPRCYLFSNSEPLDNSTQSNQVHTYQANWKAYDDPRGES